MAEAFLRPYPEPHEREEQLEDHADALGAEIRVLGRSVEGRPIRAIRIPRDDGTADPDERVLVCANIHGVEWIASYVALGFLGALRRPRPALRALMERAEVWVVPCINPDGYASTWGHHGVGPLSKLRANAHGVDLNRNYPLPAPQPRYAHLAGGFAAGSTDPQSSFYKGEAPLSEPETQTMDRFFAEVPLRASVSLHSFMGTLFSAHVERRDHLDGYRRLCRAFRQAQRLTAYRWLASRRFDWFLGEQEDHQHHVYGTWATCVEIFPVAHSLRQHLRAPSTFWRFNPREPRRYLENDIPGIVAYFHAALNEGPPAP